MRWSAKFCADRTSVALVEASVSEVGRDFDVEVNGQPRGRISLLRSHGPGVAIGSTGVLIWGGVRLYWIDGGTAEISQCNMAEEVFAAFEISARRWLLVFELSVGLWQPDRGISSRVEIDDVAASYAVDESGLLLSDFGGKKYRIEVSPADDVLKLRRI